MKSVAVISASGSPGTTVTSLLLGMGLREPLTAIELSQTGGTIAGLCGLRWQPGGVDLAAAAATAGELTSTMLAQHAQHPPSGVPVVVGPSNALEAVGAAKVLTPLLVRSLRQSSGSGVLIADCGLLGPSSLLWSLAVTTDVTLVVVRSECDQGETAARVFHARALADALAQDGAHLGLVVVGDDVRAVAGQIRLPLVASIPVRPEIVAAVKVGIPERDRAGVGKVTEQLATRSRALAEAARSRVVANTGRMGASR